MRKRSVATFSCMLVALMAVIIRVLELSQGGLSEAADQQSSLTITVANVRGTIYDRNMKPLVNRQTSYRACVAGFPEAIAAVAPELDEEAMAALEERLRILLSDREKAEKMGRNASKLLEEYRPEHVDRTWMDYLLSFLPPAK